MHVLHFDCKMFMEFVNDSIVITCRTQLYNRCTYFDIFPQLNQFQSATVTATEIQNHEANTRVREESEKRQDERKIATRYT